MTETAFSVVLKPDRAALMAGPVELATIQRRQYRDEAEARVILGLWLEQRALDLLPAAA